MQLVFLLGKILFGGFFILNGLEHFINSKKLTGYAKHIKIPMPKESVYVSSLLLLLGGFSILLEAWVELGLLLLILFMLVVTFMAHRFWTIKDEQTRMNEKIAFMKNFALIGALIMLLAMSAN